MRSFPAIVLFWVLSSFVCKPAEPPRLDHLILLYEHGIQVTGVKLTDGRAIAFPYSRPLFTLVMNGNTYSSEEAEVLRGDTVVRFVFENGVSGTFSTRCSAAGCAGVILLRNSTNDTVRIENLVPLGTGKDHVYLTAGGPSSLVRARLFLPGHAPVGVVLPDNAWELGYASSGLNGNLSACMLARRKESSSGTRNRYSTLLKPRGWVEYRLYADIFEGVWQHGLKKMFHDHYLYDLADFDETLYKRADLQWIKKAYVIVMQMAWDHTFYDRNTRKYRFYSFLKEGRDLFGGYDVYALWPTWPRLGLDHRTQWQLYEDLPLGVTKIKELAEFARHNGTRFFISFNPWDTYARQADPVEGLARMIRLTTADGVVLDTRGSSSKELQQLADTIRKGVIMYSEGMAVPKDMPEILAGRVHDAIFLSPPLNLNKVIRPDFSIFRVCQLGQGRLHREVNISLFNGYGVEINTFAPGRPDWIREEYKYLGRVVRILRENNKVFVNNEWTPLLPSLHDSIWINRWQAGLKTVYTVLSFDAAGYQGPLTPVMPEEGYHYVSLWHHRPVEPIQKGHSFFLPVDVKGYPASWKKTRREGSVDCIARFPHWLNVELTEDTLKISTDKGDAIRLWKGDPSYQNTYEQFPARDTAVNLRDLFRPFEGKYVIQLFEGDQLADEQIVELPPGKPYLISKTIRTPTLSYAPNGMVLIPEGDFIFKVSNPDQFIPYPDHSKPVKVHVQAFYMDKYPVTNEQFYDFMLATHYKPSDPDNFLRHWQNGKYPEGMSNYPVVWVSLEDARAYARWAKKRLPTEIEWQYAAQGNDGRIWPWGNDFYGTRCNNNFTRPTPVDAFPKGKSPFKVEDLVGNVWQMTNDVYDNGSYTFVIIRGGSFYNPDGRWYLKGGPQPLDHTQMLLMVSPGYDRSPTVGFRCVRDVR